MLLLLSSYAPSDDKTWTCCLGMTPDATRVVLKLENDDSE